MDHLWLYIAAMAAALVLTPVVARVAAAMNLFDLPGLRKIHAAKTPRVGGVAILLAVGLAMLAGWASGNTAMRPLQVAGSRIWVLGAAAAVVFAMGLLDDIRGMRAGVKFLVQVGAALLVCASGIRLQVLGVDGWGHIDLGIWSWPITCFWIVSISNALNLIDGLDGLAGGISLIACGAMAVLAWRLNLGISVTGLVVLMGALTGFLFFNMHPAQVFLGDCGALLLGFLLAESSVEAASHSSELLGLGTLGLVLGVPILDVCASVGRRLLQRRSISAADRGHVHHRLLEMGLSHPAAVLAIHMATLMAAMVSLTLSGATDISRIAILGCGAALLVVLFRRACMGTLAGAAATVRDNLALWVHGRRLKRLFDGAQLRLRLADDFDQWWQGVCAAAESMGLGRMGMTIDSRANQHRSLIWTGPAFAGDGDRIHVDVPVRHRRPGPLLSLRIEIPVAHSLEAAGQIASRFVRLMEQNSIAHLPAQQAAAHPAASLAA